MTEDQATASLVGGIGLLERAINYTLGSLHLVTPQAMSRPTPCRQWDLRVLLVHMTDSLAALCQAGDFGYVGLDPSDEEEEAVDPVAPLRNLACGMLGAWTSRGDASGIVTLADRSLTTSIVASAGAVEVAVHGWDVAEACGHHRPIAASLAEEMLELSQLLVSDADRPVRFAPPLAVPPDAGPADRLIAFLGRDPRSPSRQP